jgi:ligand-binding sensor domain-containing protein/signal transduction histidine kinase
MRPGKRFALTSALVIAAVLLMAVCLRSVAAVSPGSPAISSVLHRTGSPQQEATTIAHGQDDAASAGQSPPAPGESIQFEHISVELGLSEGSVYCIFQDSRGFLWFCTQDGLDRYDGYNFKVYRPEPERNSIAFPYVHSVCESPAGVLWIATMGGGLDRFDLETEQFRHYPQNPDGSGPSGRWITSLFCDRDGGVWMGTTAAGLNRFYPATNEFIYYRHQDDYPATLSHDAVNAIYRDREGVLWIGTDAGLDRGDPIGQRFIHYQTRPGDPGSLGGTAVQAIYQDREGALWIGTDGGLDRFDRETEQFVHYQPNPDDAQGARGSLSSNSVQSIFQDQEGTLWIGTDGGLNRFDPGDGQFIRYRSLASDSSSLSNDWILSIHQDREGVLWFGTYGGGLNKYDRFAARFAHYRVTAADPSSLSSNQIWSIYEDRAGVLWLGTAAAGLDRLDREQGIVTNYRHDPADPNSLSYDAVRAVYEDREGMLWIGTDGGGLDRFDPSTEQFTNYRHDPDDPHSLSHNAIRAILEDRKGVLWIATDGGGLSRFDRDTERFVRYTNDPEDPGSLSANSVWSLAEDQFGTLWVGTAGGGLYKFHRDTERFTRYAHDPSDIMLCIHEDRHGRLWIATYGNGLYRFDRGSETYTVYREEDGLPSNAIYGILEEDAPPEGGGGHLWLSTNNGLSRFDPQTEMFKNYGVSDGVQSREFRTGAYHMSRSGEMFFGGVNGFNAFYPDRILEDNPYVPPIVLTSFAQGGVPLAAGPAVGSMREFTVEWPQNFFEFEFAALSYSRPEKNEYAYMLDGFDKDWINVGTRRFGRYTNLPGGTYTLRIKGSNGGDVWNEEGVGIRISVIPPFWQTWTFRIIILGVLAFGAVGVYRQRVRGVEARSRELARQVEERTSEIEQRRRVAEGLRDILAVLNSDRPLDEVLDYIVAQAGQLLGAAATVLHQIEKEQQRVAIQASAGLPDELEGIEAIPFDASWADEAILTRQPYAIPDLAEVEAQAGISGDPQAEPWLTITSQHYHSFLAVPLIVEGEADHCLAFYYAEPQAFTGEDLGLAVALADQAALAIENARLYERAKKLATVEERQRLARDLHDAVSQTLFSASLIAEALPELWQTSPEEGQELLGKLQQLSRGALAEMRALLMELRPATLAEASMRDLLRQLGQAVSGREGIPVTVTVEETCELLADVQIALYRIAQEALNNVVKHARASRVEVSLDRVPLTPGLSSSLEEGRAEGVRLRIRDDGSGFDPNSVSQERLGLGIMHERAASIGARIEIESEPGQGTLVEVVWPTGNEEEVAS